jgi:phage terminase large subunit-like protein
VKCQTLGQRPIGAKAERHSGTKQASGSAKIDPLMAAFNAITWMAANPASSQRSIFVI